MSENARRTVTIVSLLGAAFGLLETTCTPTNTQRSTTPARAVPIATPDAGRATDNPEAQQKNLRCRDQLCRVPDEVCCITHGKGRCIAGRAPLWNDDAESWERQVDACVPKRPDGPTLLASCDDPGDCAAGQVCCVHQPFQPSESTWLSACSLVTNRWSPCSGTELCTTTSDCMQPGTECSHQPSYIPFVGGTCRLAPRSDAWLCGRSWCAPEQHCCGDKPECSDAPCGEAPSFNCFMPDHCNEGENCVLEVTGTRCRAAVGSGSKKVCAIYGHCLGVCPEGQAPECRSSKRFPWVSTCECD